MLAVGLLHFGWLPCPKVDRGDANAKPGAFLKLHGPTKGATDASHPDRPLPSTSPSAFAFAPRRTISLRILYYVLSLPEKVDPLPTLTVQCHYLCCGQSESSLLPQR